METQKNTSLDNALRAIQERKLNIYTKISSEVADEIGIIKNPHTRGYNDARDAFRHSYSVGLVSMRWGNQLAYLSGEVNEWKNHLPGGNVLEHEEWMDRFNNDKGLEIAEKIKASGGSEEDFKFAVKEALENGELVITPYDPRRTYEKHGDWEKAKQESKDLMLKDKNHMESEARAKNNGVINEEFRQKIENRFKSHEKDYEQVEEKYRPDSTSSNPPPLTFAPEQPQSQSGFEPVSFEEIDSLSTDDMTHQLDKAMATGGSAGRQLLGRLSRAVTGQMLARMDGLVRQQVERQVQQGGYNGGLQAPIGIPEPDGRTREAIEGTLNHPQNEVVFAKLAKRVEAILRRVDDADPGVVLVSKVMDVLRGGNIKLKPHILVPDLLPQEDGPQRQPQGDERVVDVGGVSIPVKLPDVRVVLDERVPGRTPDFNPDANRANDGIGGLHRGADGAVEVRAYTRSDGTRVAAHSRTAPDGDVGNNLRKKGGVV